MTRAEELDHAWVRSALTDPPPWGESLPDEWLDIELNFYRRTGGTPNQIGGFSGLSAPESVLIINGHADLIIGEGLISDNLSVGAVKRHYEIVCPVPADLTTLPRKGDRVWWYDALQRRIDVAVKSVDAPEGLADHLEIESDEFE